MKFLIAEPYPLPILILLGPKYSPRDPVFRYLYTYILIVKFLERSREDKSDFIEEYDFLALSLNHM
jgi:hypothetical protein